RRSVSHLGPAAVYRADVSGDTFYRLRLGPFVDPNDADRLLAQVVQAGYPGARITAD
ncbi:MAG TPA: septal ring lytic transglycosylase RlpA family protein, partial [Thalassospira sp.]|nr:septal ring lytic transglycosylase RlpA family protein [Thalassospira sp.]